jgi:hypothetical protein
MYRVVFIAMIAALLAIPPSRADVPTLLSFQGILKTPTGTPLEGAQTVRFSLYNAPEGDQIVTDEPQTFANGTITLGHIPVVAGSETVRKADNTVTYTRGTAYTINNASGIVTSLTIPDATAVLVNYHWTPALYWTETQTVQATHGLFAVLLGVNTSVPYNSLTGNDWLGLEVQNGSTWQALSPRQRLTAAPYALRTASINGADAGTVNGSLRATGTVTGTGSSTRLITVPRIRPGVQGNGVTGLGGDAPGVLAVGATSTSVALSAQGRIASTGEISAPSINLTGDATIQGSSHISGDGIVGGDMTVAGVVTGRGGLKPDYDSGTQTMTVSTNGQPLTLPSSLGIDPYSLLVDFTDEAQISISGTSVKTTAYRPPSDSRITYYLWIDPSSPGTLRFWAWRDDASSVGKFRVRIWKLR